MKERKINISDNGKSIGEVLVFKGPKFTGGMISYSAIDLAGKTIGCAQPPLEMAVALLRSQQ